MPVVALDVRICNTAILLVGGSDINALDDETQEAQICAALYERTVCAMLELYPWRFSMKQETLSRVNNFTPLAGYSYAYQLPADRLRAVFKPYTTMQYRILGDKLYSSSATFVMEYQYRAPEALWSESFSRAVEFDLARALAIGLLDDSGMADNFEALMKTQLKMAKQIDGQQQTGDAPNSGRFNMVRARF